MNDELSHKFVDVKPEKMIQILNESFGTLEDVERNKTSCILLNAHMREGASVTDHILLYIIEQIEHLSKLEFLLHEQLGKNVVGCKIPPAEVRVRSDPTGIPPASNFNCR